MPFGEEAFIGVGNRAVGHGYTYGDSTRQKFTGYQRDEETNLDFAQARMHNYNHGRFTSPDPLMASAKRIAPQTWNRYSYVVNRPTLFVDPSGEKWGEKRINARETRYCWLPGEALCDGFSAKDDGTILFNARINGKPVGAIRLNGDGTWSTWLTVQSSISGGNSSSEDARVIRNVTGGLLCSFSTQMLCLQEEGSETARKVKTAADVVQWAFLVKTLVASGLSYAAIATFIRKNRKNGVRGAKLLARARDNLLKRANDPRLKSAIRELYRDTAKVGNGSAMDVMRYEKETGVLLSKSGHTKKLVERRTNLLRIFKDKSVSDSDRQITKELFLDIQDALSAN